MKWTKDEVNTLIEMRNKGCAFRDIALVVGKTRGECFAKARNMEAQKVKSRENRARTAALADRIREMFEQGMSDKEIYTELDLSANALNSIKKMHGIARTPKQQAFLLSRLSSLRAQENNMDINKKTICWTCKNAMINCKKPVKGFVAEKVRYGDDLPLRYTYFVSECPNYAPEPYAGQKGGREK